MERPRAILFWNLIASYKVFLADGLFGIPVFDVSPGEMFFKSFNEYFQRPRAELSCRNGGDYGSRLAGVVVKYASEKQVAHTWFGIEPRVIRNGVPLPPKRIRLARKRRRLILGAAARIAPDKRLEDLIDAIRLAHPRLPPYELRIAGKTEFGAEQYAEELRLLARALPVVWLGELPGTAHFLEQLDLFVMISEPAGCPNASLEAMAAGLPLIATAVGGAGEQVIDRGTGRLVPPRDGPALASAMIELAADVRARIRYGAAARVRIEAEFSMDAMVAAYADLWSCQAKLGCSRELKGVCHVIDH